MTAQGVATDCAIAAAAITDRNAERDRLTARLAEIAQQIAALEQSAANQTQYPAPEPSRAAHAGNDNSMNDDQAVSEKTAPTKTQTEPSRESTGAAPPDDHRAGIAAEARQQPEREAALLATMERQEQDRRAFVEEQTAAAAKARAEQAEREQEEARRTRNGDVTDAKGRYAVRATWLL
jgi:hypothetical protein